jgi:hypothetical protein
VIVKEILMRRWVLAFVLVGVAQTAYAQEGRRGAAPFVRLGVESETVKSAPYSAEVINQSIQTLSDGNKIVRTTTSRVYRDSEGRVRREEDRPSGSPGITITDPVAGSSWALDSNNHIARQRPVVSRAYNAQLGLSVDMERLTVLLNGQPSVLAASPVWVAGPNGSNGEQSTEERLAPRVVEGVRVEGTRRTWTIAAGAIGNERAIVTTTEEWTSPELKVLLLSEHADPRTGTSTYKLVNLKRAEPAASLFQVPPDYTITQAPGAGEGRGTGRGAGGDGRAGRSASPR